MLPDSNSNEPESHGFIVFRLNTVQVPQIGQVISNKAAIYFVYNEPVITNTVFNTYVDPVSVAEQSRINMHTMPNPFGEHLIFQTEKYDGNPYTIEIHEITGKLVRAYADINTSSFTMPRKELASGIYFYRIRYSDQVISGKIIAE
jgi:hypothetical protein